MPDPKQHRASDRVPADAVRPSPTAVSVDVKREHVYKAAGLLFLFAIVLNFFEVFAEVLLLAYAAAILAVLFNAVVRRLPLQRKLTAGALGLLILVTVGTLLWFGVPALIAQIRDLAGRATEFEAMLLRVEFWLQSTTGLNVSLVGPEARQLLQNMFMGGEAGTDMLARAQSLLGIIIFPLLILFGALYAVGKPNEQLLSPLLRTVPRDRRLAFRRAAQLLGDRILGWVKGLLLSMVGVAVLSFLLYSLIGVPNALLLAVISGLMEAIPILGPWIGGAMAVSVALLDDPTKALYTALAALAIQQIENNLILPFAMSHTVKIHPFVTLFALLLFGGLFGFLGVLLSIPLVLLIATIVQVFWVERAIDTDEDTIMPVVEE
jgi:predicted PurR-regulated permease PerM